MKTLFLLLLSLPAFALDARYEGTVDLSNCSGFVFTTPQFTGESKALLMTNGHCLSTLWGIVLSPGEARADRSGSRKVGIVTERGTKLQVKTERLVYATMTGTDMAVYQLGLTYNELAERGIRPFSLSAPVLNESVEVISGHKNNAHTCTIERMGATSEGGFKFVNALRFSAECEQGNGTSGSPVIRTGTREVVAIANSFNKNGKACGNNNPCEITEEGKVEVFHRARYGQQVTGILGCLDFDGKFNNVSCELTLP